MEWRPTAGRRTSNALIPIVGDKVVDAEDHTTLYDVEELAYRRSKTEYTHTHTHTHRGTKNMSIHTNATVTISTIATNLYKRLQGHFI